MRKGRAVGFLGPVRVATDNLAPAGVPVGVSIDANFFR